MAFLDTSGIDLSNVRFLPQGLSSVTAPTAISPSTGGGGLLSTLDNSVSSIGNSLANIYNAQAKVNAAEANARVTKAAGQNAIAVAKGQAGIPLSSQELLLIGGGALLLVLLFTKK